MYSEAWLYTLSAIPQTLAAMIALVATFIIYKLSRLKDHIALHSEEVKVYLPSLADKNKILDINSLFEEDVVSTLKEGLNNFHKLNPEDLKYIMSRYGEVVVSQPGVNLSPEKLKQYLIQKTQLLETLLAKKNLAYNKLKTSLLFTAIPIIISLIILPFYGFMVNPGLILLFLVALSGLSVIYTVHSVWEISKI